MKLDSLHFALLVAIVLLAIYAFGSFREEMQIPPENRNEYSPNFSGYSPMFIGVNPYDGVLQGTGK